MTELILWTRPMLNRFKREYGKARKADVKVFTFDGHEFLPDFAKYLIEYLDQRIAK